MAITESKSSPRTLGPSGRRALRVLLVVVGISGMVALAAYARSLPDRRSRICRQNLTRLDGAIERWALDHGYGESPEKFDLDSMPTYADLYALDGSKYLTELPICPSGGSYRIERFPKSPSCSSGLPDHTIDDFCEACAAAFAAEAAGLPVPPHAH